MGYITMRNQYLPALRSASLRSLRPTALCIRCGIDLTPAARIKSRSDMARVDRSPHSTPLHPELCLDSLYLPLQYAEISRLCRWSFASFRRTIQCVPWIAASAPGRCVDALARSASLRHAMSPISLSSSPSCLRGERHSRRCYSRPKQSWMRSERRCALHLSAFFA